MVQMDKQRTWQVLGNFLHNARHFIWEKGKGKIIVKVVCDKDGPGYDVTDTLGLINPEDMPYLFDRFFSRRKGGSGLGLAYNKDAMHEQKGTISASCKKDVHTTFHVRYKPAPPPAASQASDKPKTSSDNEGAKEQQQGTQENKQRDVAPTTPPSIATGSVAKLIKNQRRKE